MKKPSKKMPGMKAFEMSKFDVEKKGTKEGSKADMASDMKQMKQMKAMKGKKGKK